MSMIFKSTLCFIFLFLYPFVNAGFARLSPPSPRIFLPEFFRGRLFLRADFAQNGSLLFFSHSLIPLCSDGISVLATIGLESTVAAFVKMLRIQREKFAVMIRTWTRPD